MIGGNTWFNTVKEYEILRENLNNVMQISFSDMVCDLHRNMGMPKIAQPQITIVYVDSHDGSISFRRLKQPEHREDIEWYNLTLEIIENLTGQSIEEFSRGTFRYYDDAEFAELPEIFTMEKYTAMMKNYFGIE